MNSKRSHLAHHDQIVPPTLEDALGPEFVRKAWEVPMLARSIRFAVATLALRRENTRLRGDLGMIGRRLTHDLRTPLNSISMAQEALVDPAMTGESATQLHQSISAAVNEAGRLIERVGTVFMASARPIELQPVDMEEIVWNARQRIEARMRSIDATLIACDRWPVVTGAASLLEVVWTNLLLNSLQHGGPAPRIEIGWKRMEAQTCFWLRDSGRGVDPAKRSRLFYPVDRLNELNAPRGYGLSIVHRLIELQFGTTGYDPDPMPGGTFFFTAP